MVVVVAAPLSVTIGFTDTGPAEHSEARPSRWGGTTRPANKELKLTKPGKLRSFAA